MTPEQLQMFERIVRKSPPMEAPQSATHPFDSRNISEVLPKKIRKLFDDGHYSHAILDAFKFIEQMLRKGSNKPQGYGSGLIKYALEGDAPKVKLRCPETEEYGKFRDNFEKMLLGAFGNLRNPHGHKIIELDPDQCLDELTIAAYFIRNIIISDIT